MYAEKFRSYNMLVSTAINISISKVDVAIHAMSLLTAWWGAALRVLRILLSKNAFTDRLRNVCVHDALLSWLPEFSARNQTVYPRFDFYPALAALLLAFIEDDTKYLYDVASLFIA